MKKQTALFHCMPVYQDMHHPLGLVELWPMDLHRDTPVIHKWVTQPYAQYWGMTNSSYEDVFAAYHAIYCSDGAYALIGKINGQPAFLCECYDPEQDLIGNYYDPEPGDVGMHLLIAPAEQRIHGFTWKIFSVVMDFLFENPWHYRVVVEPDVRNEKIHRLNKRAGFVYDREVVLPHKTAALAFCTRQQYLKSKENN